MRLGLTTLPRAYVLRSGEEVQVEPPTVGQAITTLDVLAASTGEEDDALLARVLLAWLPEVVARDLASRDRAGLVRRLGALVMQGYTPTTTKRREGASAEADRKRGNSWPMLLSTFCATYGGGVWETWERMPFPLFLAMSEEATGERARRTLEDALAASLPHAGKSGRKALRDLKRRAAGRRDERGDDSDFASLTRPPTAAEVAADEAALEADIARLYGAPGAPR